MTLPIAARSLLALALVLAPLAHHGGGARAATETDASSEALASEPDVGAVATEPAANDVKPEAGEATEEVVEGAAPLPPLWAEMPVVELAKQPYVLIRKLRTVQDDVAAGSATAHEQQRLLMRDLAAELRSLPVAVWDDVRNVRAAIFFVLSGGDPVILKGVLDRPKTPHIERRLVKGALAYGEGRLVDTLAQIHKIKARDIDASLGGMIALIQGTLTGKKDSAKAIAYFDEARLLAPGTLIEESALRQQILLLAKEGELERFDLLTEQYSRRFPRSLFARNFRRQFFAGVARQNFKRSSEWVSRTETELMKVPAAERAGMYLAIAEEATKGGNLDIARFAANKARSLSFAGSRQIARAELYEGAALAASDEFEQGVLLLGNLDVSKLSATDQELHASALLVARAVGRWPAEGATPEDVTPSASLARAQSLLDDVDSLLGGQPQ